MPVLTIQFNITSEQLTAVDLLRGNLTLDQFLRFALQLGIIDLQEEAARVGKEAVFQALGALTSNFQHARGKALLDPPPQASTNVQDFASEARIARP